MELRLLVADRPVYFWSYVYSVTMSLVTIWGVLNVLIQSVPKFHFSEFFVQDLIIVIFFTVDFVLQTLALPLRKTLLNPLTYCDVLAIVPSWVSIGLGSSQADLRFLRSLRVFRVLRVLRLASFSHSLEAMGKGLVQAWKVLFLLFVTMLVYLFIFATMLWFAEMTEADLLYNPPEGIYRWIYVVNNFGVGKPAGTPTSLQNIPQCMYWAAITLFTIGYGDIYPVTPLGRAVGWLSIVCGSFLLAGPMGLYGPKMNDALTKSKIYRDMILQTIIHEELDYWGRLELLQESLEQLLQRAEQLEKLSILTNTHLKVLQETVQNLKHQNKSRPDFEPEELDEGSEL